MVSGKNSMNSPELGIRLKRPMTKTTRDFAGIRQKVDKMDSFLVNELHHSQDYSYVSETDTVF